MPKPEQTCTVLKQLQSQKCQSVHAAVQILKLLSRLMTYYNKLLSLMCKTQGPRGQIWPTITIYVNKFTRRQKMVVLSFDCSLVGEYISLLLSIITNLESK